MARRYRSVGRMLEEAMMEARATAPERPIIEIPEPHFVALKMSVRGYRKNTIAKALGRDRHTIARWLANIDPRVQRWAVDEFFAEYDRERLEQQRVHRLGKPHLPPSEDGVLIIRQV